ncbi:MAG: polysaccharide deacetylase family protein [Gammaproteobacteria bacterium]|nr:polysaccharide deacetylase family protein [Gammaproteobacteria bacterium]
MKKLLRLIVRCFGLVHILRFLNRRKVTILMLHGVAGDHPEAGWQPLWPRVTPGKLDTVLTQLGRHYEFVSLDDAVEMLSGSQPMRNNCLALTFDDGYRNNLTEAWPVLKKHGAPATFFVATGFVGSGRSFWIDRLDYALQTVDDRERLVAANGETFDLRGLARPQLAEHYTHLRLAIKNSVANDDEMLRIFDAISSSLEAKSGSTIDDVIETDPYVSVADWQELADVAREGVTIGSHTVDHFRLDAVPDEVVDSQLARSKADIESNLQRACTLFCYPNGSYTDAVCERTRRAGYRAAVTTEKGLNGIGDDLYRLKRYAMPAKATAFDNLLAISGFSELPLLRRLAGGRS